MNKPELYFKKFKYCKNETKKFNSITISLKSETLKTSELDELGKYPVVNSGLDLYGKYNKYNNLGDAFTIASRGEYVGNIHYFKDKFWAGGLCYPYKCINLYNTRLVSIYMEYNFYTIRKLFMNTTGIPAINKKDLETFKVTLPSNLEEQQKISTFLSAFDLKIEHESQIIEQLKQLKKSLLYKMFPTENSNVPELRFKGFTETWEQCKLKNFTERIIEKNKNLDTLLPLTISTQYGLISQTEFFNKQIASKNLSNYYLLKKGDFAYNKSYSGEAPWGSIKRLDKYEKGALSTLYIAFKIKNINQIDSEFLNTFYKTNKWYTDIQNIATEGARNHGLLNISSNDFFETFIKIPNLEEQKKIGDFFSKIDSLITLHQRKYDKLVQVKKALLSKMFV